MAVQAGLVVAALLFAGIAAAPDGRDAEGDATCEESANLVRCSWSLRSEGLATSHQLQQRAFERSLVTVMVVLSGDRAGADGGWRYNLTGPEDQTYSEASHYASNDPADAAQPVFQQIDTHLLLTGGTGAYWLNFRTGARPYALTPAPAEDGSTGAFTVTIITERIPNGIVPARPAATADDPQLLGAPGGDRPDLDMLAAWLDDERLDDGLMDVHMRVRDLSMLSDALRQGATGATTPVASWYVMFQVRGDPFFVRWFAKIEDPSGEPVFGCELRRGTFDPDARNDLAAVAQGTTLLVNPVCRQDFPTSELHAVFPERSLANPAPGERFTGLRAYAVAWEETGTPFITQPAPRDSILTARYDFALGGPAVWSTLNARLDPPPVPPWYSAPFHEQNLPDTLQVIGAVAASLTFLGGVFLVAIRRRRTRGLLDEVDRVAERHESDARQALLSLGELDARITHAFRAGKLHEGTYQVVAQRIAANATRFALRRELGLDDGTPGDGPIARRVPVRVDEDLARR